MEQSELLSTLMGMLGDHPEETIKQALNALGVKNEESADDTKKNESDASANENLMLPAAPTSFDLNALAPAIELMGTLSHTEESDRARLLAALKPFLSLERRKKIDSVTKLLRLLELAEVAQKSGILKDLL